MPATDNKLAHDASCADPEVAVNADVNCIWPPLLKKCLACSAVGHDTVTTHVAEPDHVPAYETLLWLVVVATPAGGIAYLLDTNVDISPAHLLNGREGPLSFVLLLLSMILLRPTLFGQPP